MRDLVIVAIVAWGCLHAIRRPWIGLLVWIWLSMMNPHRYAYGFAFTAPLAQVTAIAVFIGLLVGKDRISQPLRGAPAVWFLLLTVWETLSWALGWDPSGDTAQWLKVIKVNVMVFMALLLLHTRYQIMAATAVLAGSLALLGIKGGIHTLMTGGGGRVWGPPGTFIGDNNEFALALVMTIPILRFLQMQMTGAWQRHAMTAVMVLCALSALGSQSRGALLAIGAMTLWLWWRGQRKLQLGLVLLVLGVGLVIFMPESWTDRMSTINQYQEDRSAMGRISAWWNAWNLAKDYPFGVGFNAARPELFARYSPYPDMVHAAHSIYFQVLGNHGYVGLLIFLALWVSTWRTAGRLIKLGSKDPDLAWLKDFGGMLQVSYIAFLVGGAFLSLVYFDFPYYLMALAVVAHQWASRRSQWPDPVKVPAWQSALGWVKNPKGAAA